MAAFKTLRDVSNNFENELRRISKELFSAKIGEPFEDVLSNKLRDLSLFNSKLRLLQAKTLTGASICTLQKALIKPIIPVTPQIANLTKSEHSISEYGDVAMWKTIEQQVVKTLTQTYSVKKLITTPSSQLAPELVERKEKIVDQLTKYRQQETQLRDLETILKEKEEELKDVRLKWDNVLSRLKDTQKVPQNEKISAGPLYRKLQVLIDKMELMRWLISKLVTSRTGGYDWINDPHRRLNALALARQRHSVTDYTEI